MSTVSSSRSILRTIPSERTLEGAGFVVRRPFPTHRLDHLDPFLLLDELGPVEFPPGEAKGAPDHPHRGFETVSYILEGRHQHKDSAGNSGTLGPGDVQWMTAGAGVVHSEMPDPEFARTGGRVHGFQLWVNLPRRDKMSPPRYQDVPASKFPVISPADGVTVKVIAGEALGARSPVETHTPILYLHVTLAPGARLRVPVERSHNAFAYIFDGEALAGPSALEAAEGDMLVFAHDGEAIELAAPEGARSMQALLVAGAPLQEPVARYGPFVMNTRSEIIQAFEDFQSGRMGVIRS